LSNRSTPKRSVASESPEHYLDYFHGRLVVSPDGRHVVDDGWIWHPFGVPVVWDLYHWLTENCWESEDGESRLSLGSREYYWNHGICWLDNDRVVVEGIGEDDERMVDGVLVYDIRDGSLHRPQPHLECCGPRSALSCAPPALCRRLPVRPVPCLVPATDSSAPPMPGFRFGRSRPKHESAFFLVSILVITIA
jgi:hypothetical protein